MFEQIDKWIRDSDETFFILTGEAGVGKSAIAARLTQIRDDIAAHHFCIAGRNSTIVPGTVLRSLAAQLGKNLDGYGDALANTIKPTYVSVNVKIHVGTMKGGQITGVVLEHLTLADPKQELESLLTASLSAMHAPARPILILLDSLDEAFTYNPSENLVTLLAGLSNLPPWVRIILTSRPEDRVLSYFAVVPKHVVAAESQMNRDDLRCYVAHRAGKPGLRARLQAAPNPIASETLVERVAGVGDDPGLAAGNFLYTKILLNDIECGVQPLDDLAALPKSLDEIYQRFLLRLAPEWEARYQPLLAVLAIAREPLSREQLLRFGDRSARLIGGRMSATLVNLALGVLVQFLDVRGGPGQERYAVFHQSLRDCLGDPVRSGRFACPPEDGHRAIADCYLAEAARDWSGCDDYGLAHLPAHLSAVGVAAELYVLLFDYRWQQAKLDRLGISALLADFGLGPAATDDAMRRLSQALTQAAHVLAQDPSQLAPQLLGRLLGDQDGQIQDLLVQAGIQCRRPCLLPLTASLRQASALVRTLTGHTGPVYDVAPTPDGRCAVSVSGDGTLKVWDLASGQELRTLTGHPDGVNAVAVTPDGRLAISGTGSKFNQQHEPALNVWNLESGTALHTLHGHGAAVTAIAVLPDGRIVSASEDTTLKVWDLGTGRLLQTMSGHEGPVMAVVAVPETHHVISASADSTLKAWDAETGQILFTLSGHQGEVSSIAITRDGKRLVSGSYDQEIKVWDLGNRIPVHTFAVRKKPIHALAVTPDGSKVIISAGSGANPADCILVVCDLITGEETGLLPGHTNRVNAVAVTPDGRWAISAAGTWIIPFADFTLKIWDIETPIQSPQQFNERGGVACIAITHDGKRVLAGLYNGALEIWSLVDATQTHKLHGHTHTITSIAITPDGQRAVTASVDRTLAVWDLERGTKVHTLRGHEDAVIYVMVTKDGKHALSYSVGDNKPNLTLKVSVDPIFMSAALPARQSDRHNHTVAPVPAG